MRAEQRRLRRWEHDAKWLLSFGTAALLVGFLLLHYESRLNIITSANGDELLSFLWFTWRDIPNVSAIVISHGVLLILSLFFTAKYAAPLGTTTVLLSLYQFIRSLPIESGFWIVGIEEPIFGVGILMMVAGQVAVSLGAVSGWVLGMLDDLVIFDEEP